MVLLIQSKPIVAATDAKKLVSCILDNPFIIASAAQALLQGKIATPLPAHTAQLFCYQREYATVKNNKALLLGSDEATTCHIAIFRNSNKTCCVHLDGGQNQIYPTLVEVLNKEFANTAEAIQTHIIGGFVPDDTATSLCKELLTYLHAIKQHFDLHTCCVLQLNTEQVMVKNVAYPSPVLRSIAINTQTGQVYFNPIFGDFGAEKPLRRALLSGGHYPLISWYDADKDEFVFDVRRASYKPTSRQVIHYLLDMDDETLLQNTSTSPYVEAPAYASDMRKNLEFQLKHRQLDKYMPIGTRFARKQDEPGAWIKL